MLYDISYEVGKVLQQAEQAFHALSQTTSRSANPNRIAFGLKKKKHFFVAHIRILNETKKLLHLPSMQHIHCMRIFLSIFI